MRIQMAARNCDVPSTVVTRTEEQLEKLLRYHPRVSVAEVVFETEKHLKKVEAVVKVDRQEPMVAGGEGVEFREAVDQMVDRLGRMLRRKRSQKKDHYRPATSEPGVGEE
jgi:ribosomal subunit interface protein